MTPTVLYYNEWSYKRAVNLLFSLRHDKCNYMSLIHETNINVTRLLRQRLQYLVIQSPTNRLLVRQRALVEGSHLVIPPSLVNIELKIHEANYKE